MKKIQIDKIKVNENVRKDYGDLTELSASIRMYGIRNPVELNSDNELIDGFRRVRAAKAAGLTETPYFVNEDKLDKAESQLISGIFQKNLNPIEEGEAFQIYLDENKITAEEFAKKISKKVIYVEKRLELAKLPKEVQEALIKKKILIGHALLLAKLRGPDGKKFLKEISSEHYSVEDARRHMTYSGFSTQLSEINFCKKDCKGCPYNGSEQTELFETGTILNGSCMNTKCFKIKLRDFIKFQKERYKGFVYESENEYGTPVGFVDGSHDWNCKEHGITEKYKEKCKEDPETYLVKIKDNGEIVEYFKIPSKKKSESGDVQASTQEESLNERREQVLTTKIHEFKSKFLIDKSIELMKPGTKQVKALAVVRLIQDSNWSDLDIAADKLGNLIAKGYGGDANIKHIFEAEESDLDKALAILSENALRKVDLKDLIVASRNFDVDIKRHFEITEDYLKLYTKDQLNDLLGEFKINLPEEDFKKADLITFILSKDLKGKIPKILL